MRSEPDFRARLRSWVITKATEQHGDRVDGISDHTPLFQERYLRSVHLPELLLLLERLRGSPIDVTELQARDFRDIDTMVRRFGGAEAVR